MYHVAKQDEYEVANKTTASFSCGHSSTEEREPAEYRVYPRCRALLLSTTLELESGFRMLSETWKLF